MPIIKILQLKRSDDLHYHRFLGWDHLKIHGLKFDIKNYDEVYEYASDDTDLENIFIKFQGSKPEGYKGHSLSVSDVVMIDNDIYYVDSFGFKKI